MGMVFGNALDNAIFGRHHGVQKSIESFVKKDQAEKKRPVVQIVIGTPPPFNEETESKKPTGIESNISNNVFGQNSFQGKFITESKRRQTTLETFNEKVFDFFELTMEYQIIESRILGEKRPKMDQVNFFFDYYFTTKEELCSYSHFDTFHFCKFKVFSNRLPLVCLFPISKSFQTGCHFVFSLLLLFSRDRHLPSSIEPQSFLNSFCI